MKKLLLLTLLVTAVNVIGFAQLGVGTTTPDSSAMLDVFSTNKGILPPRIALSFLTNASPVANPATGLVVYNTASAGAGVNSVSPGYYYWTGSSWFSLSIKGTHVGDILYWNGTQWLVLPIGHNGSALIVCNGVPRWGGCPGTTIAIVPATNPNETYLYNYVPNSPGWGTSQLPVMAWTHNGTPSVSRIFIKFNYTIPDGASIKSAKLSLFAATPNPNSGNLIDANYGAANGMYVQRVTSAWSNATATWNSPPTTTTLNQLTIPQSTSATENSVDIDVTQLVKDMQQHGNNGFSLRLITENYYNSRQYISSYNADAGKHPKLVITYNP